MSGHGPMDILTRRYGDAVPVTYYSGSSLNRVAFLRRSHEFLTAAFHHPTARILLLDSKCSPLVRGPGSDSTPSGAGHAEKRRSQDQDQDQDQDQKQSTKPRSQLLYVSAQDLAGYYDKPFRDSAALIANSSGQQSLVIFLGIDEGARNSNGGPANQSDFSWEQYSGRPYFAVQASPIAEEFQAKLERLGGTWLQDVRATRLENTDAANYALARHLADWHSVNLFCASCGARTRPTIAGWKRECSTRSSSAGSNASSPTPAPASAPALKPCPTMSRLSANCFPRTDPTVIVAVINSAATHVLLGRQSSFPARWYSTLAGFVEPGESLEEAVAREVWEEAGVSVARVMIVASQPWPFPGNLMIGAIAVAKKACESIYLGHDKELEDARWFALDEVADALQYRTWTRKEVEYLFECEAKKAAAEAAGSSATGVTTSHADMQASSANSAAAGKIALPPETAIAHTLITKAVQLMKESSNDGPRI